MDHINNNNNFDSIIAESLKRIRNNLLDLSPRNQLLRFRHGKDDDTGRGRKNLRIVDELPNQIADMLLEGIEVGFLPVPEPTKEELIKAGYIGFDSETGKEIELKSRPSAREWAKYLGISVDYEMPYPNEIEEEAPQHNDRKIQTLLYPSALDSILKKIYYTANTAIQEMGINVLYLALGFLEWFDSKDSEIPNLAPLFLIPVKLNKGRLNQRTRIYEYTLEYLGEDIIPNYSLREKLKNDFNMALPDIDENITPEEYFKQTKEMFANRNVNWKVRRYITLGLFNFNKLLMYLDLDPNRWPKGNDNIAIQPLMLCLLKGQCGQEKDSPDGNFSFEEEYPIDEIKDIHNKYPLIENADSSQHSAIIDILEGKNLVIEGPPGTGKSQTITNIIAAALARGKNVLFVAEKLAALEVVKRRLDKAQLGEFCLELHSYKTQKSLVINSLADRLRRHRKYRKPKDIEIDIERFEELKSILKGYVEKINGKWKNTGKTIHEIFAKAVRYRGYLNVNPENIWPEGYGGDNYDDIVQLKHIDNLKIYIDTYENIASESNCKLHDRCDLTKHPWYGVFNGGIDIFSIKEIKESLLAWQNILERINEENKRIASILGCNPEDVADSFKKGLRFVRNIEGITNLQGNERLDLVSKFHSENLEAAKEILKISRELRRLYKELSADIGGEVLNNKQLVEKAIKEYENLRLKVKPDIKLHSLSKVLNDLKSIHEQLQELADIISEVKDYFGEAGVRYLTVNLSGLKELKKIIELVSFLEPQYLTYRNDIFDKDIFDFVLEKLEKDLEEINGYKKEIEGVFDLSNMNIFPSEDEILQLYSILSNGGIFCWFDKNWRRARSQVNNFAINRKVGLAKLKGNLLKLSKIIYKANKIARNEEYRKVFGELFKGTDTNVELLKRIRNWYKNVRKVYGTKFGRKVVIGEAILSLPQDVIEALYSLHEKGIERDIEHLLNDISNLQEVFFEALNIDGDILLIQDGNMIDELYNFVNRMMDTYKYFVVNDAVTVGNLLNIIEKVKMFNKKKGVVKNRLDKNLILKEFINFDFIFDDEIEKQLFSLENTLKIIDTLSGPLASSALSHYVYANCSKETLELLKNIKKDVEKNISAYKEAYIHFKNLTDLKSKKWFLNVDKNINSISKRNKYALDNMDKLQQWISYVNTYKQIKELGLGRLLDAVDNGVIEIDSMLDAYNAGIYDLLAKEILKEYPDLEKFSSYTQEEIRKQFIDYDNKIRELQCKLVAWKIDQRKIPMGKTGATVRELTDLYLIKHEIPKKRKHIPIRQLFKKAINAVMAIKPCFMMSPMSVAQYFEPGSVEFDLVIMDEASQIRPENALGAIARGRQLVVVGDPKQLPPTNFFEVILNKDEGEDTFVSDDKESILDVALDRFTARRLRLSLIHI